ncbi:3'(2'),5'-bisphosphate nucleotidase CysQ [Candidatus Parcubacteria bacterium]|nr:3'(2'),5'-bisphosphate nucleotidase CysQ [Candidatus Parcubacteria bacterium]
MIKDIDKILEQVLNIITKAGQTVLSYYGQNLNIKDKGNDSPVTVADLESNKVLVSGLREFGWPILSEEGVDDKKRFGAELVWIIDPLDGTKDFIQETGEFTIMIGLVEKQANNTYRPILGVIYRPTAKTIYYAIKGGGVWAKQGEHKPRLLKVAPVSKWQDIIMLTSRNHTTDLEKRLAKKLGIPKILTYGSSLKACLIADKKGHINLNTTPKTFEWDVCASDIIVHEAGGKFTDSKGKLFNYNKKDPRNQRGYAATNGIIHDEIIENIKEL